jgi:hypothetical protein
MSAQPHRAVRGYWGDRALPDIIDRSQKVASMRDQRPRRHRRRLRLRLPHRSRRSRIRRQGGPHRGGDGVRAAVQLIGDHRWQARSRSSTSRVLATIRRPTGRPDAAEGVAVEGQPSLVLESRIATTARTTPTRAASAHARCPRDRAGLRRGTRYPDVPRSVDDHRARGTGRRVVGAGPSRHGSVPSIGRYPLPTSQRLCDSR